MLSSYAFVGIRKDDLPKIISRLPPDEIIFSVCKFYGLKIKEIKARNRKKGIVQARFVASYFLKTYTKLTLKEIAECFGEGMTDHSSVIHAVKSIKDQLSLKEDNDTKDDVEAIKQTFVTTIKNETINSRTNY